MTEFKSWRSFRNFEYAVRQELRYVRTAETEEFLLTVAETSHYRVLSLQAGNCLWRAQVAYSIDSREQDGYTLETVHACPADRMKPRRDRASAGRANSVGIPCLYLATDKDTAMCEARPPGISAFLTVGQFRITRDCKIVDCSKQHGFQVYFEEPGLAEKREAVWRDIDSAFAQPMISEEGRPEYVATQVLAELFKHHGYDGVAYRSNFGEDYNVALFELDAAVLVDRSVYAVEKIKMEFKACDNEPL